MADVQQTVQQADKTMQREGRRIAQRPWVEALARFGYAAKSVVYGLIGVLAAMTAIGAGGATTDSQGALQTLRQQLFGQIALLVIAVGMIGYTVWRIVQAILDTEDKRAEPGGIAQRIGYLISAITYGGLALAAARLGLGFGNQDNSTGVVAQVMSLPFGRILIAIVGAVIIGIGGYQMYRAFTGSFEKELRSDEMSEREQHWAKVIGRIGLTGHGVVFGLTGVLVILAAIRQDPEQAQGIDGALTTLASQPFGPYLLGAAALGLIAYGIFSCVEARYRRMMFN